MGSSLAVGTSLLLHGSLEDFPRYLDVVEGRLYF